MMMSADCARASQKLRTLALLTCSAAPGSEAEDGCCSCCCCDVAESASAAGPGAAPGTRFRASITASAAATCSAGMPRSSPCPTYRFMRSNRAVSCRRRMSQRGVLRFKGPTAAATCSAGMFMSSPHPTSRFMRSSRAVRLIAFEGLFQLMQG